MVLLSKSTAGLITLGVLLATIFFVISVWTTESSTSGKTGATGVIVLVLFGVIAFISNKED